MEKSIIINTDEYLEDKLLRVNKRTKLILKPGPKCLALDVIAQTNYPLKKGSKFDRSQYHQLPVVIDHQDLISSSFNWSISLVLELAGTFRIVCCTSGDKREIWSAYIVVEPEMKIPIDTIKCQTVLSKNLGLLKEWRQRLTVTKEAKYNMIHFTPIQELGGSNSAYAIRNQHKVNPMFKASLDDIKKEVDFMEKKWNILSVTDIVLNHTSDDSQWIHEHPECAYNLANSPHLRPAFLLDSALLWFTQDLCNGIFDATDSLTADIKSERDIQTVGILLKSFYVPQLKIYELFMIDPSDAIKQFDSLPRSTQLVIDYGLYKRNGAKISSIPHHIKSSYEFHQLIGEENLHKRNEIKALLISAIDNALNSMRYERLNPNGPYYGRPVGPDSPLVAPYFTHSSFDDFKMIKEEALMYKSGQRFMAHNGWVMGSSSNEDFASPSSQVYLRRELIAWGDNIKLRYGSKVQDAPYLWEHMRKYVESQAKVFHGFRIDNCHSTPLHVAEYLIDSARSIRPDIYIMAELFTSSESTDNVFVNRLGITSLIREAMSAHDSRELGRLIYRFGGTPIGAFYQQGAKPLKSGVAHAVFYDQTHDNDSPIITRSAYDLPATMSLINMANCATGSNKGYDELVPHHINVVTEERLYSSDFDENVGIIQLRRLVNGVLQRELSQGFNEIFVDQVNDEVIAITRQNPTDGRSIVLIARTAFSPNQSGGPISSISIQGKVSKILFEAQAYGDPNSYVRDKNIINGLNSFKVKIFSTNSPANESKLAKIVHLGEDRDDIQFNEFQFLPSSVLAVEIRLSDRQSEALKYLNQWKLDINQFNVNFNDANFILFHCREESEWKPYNLVNFCEFTYCGLYGLMYYLNKVRENQDQAHPLTENLRQGNWLSEYIVTRLKTRETTVALAEHLDSALKQVDLLPRGMVPKYFDLIISTLYNELVGSIYSKLSVFVSKGPILVKLLTLSSVALIGENKSAPLPPIESKLEYLPSIAAGLPHFSSGYMRNWGRDTFIALRGLLLITGRFCEAKSIILSYARTLNHGLIPNLIDGGVKSRYNCRDAVWWWLYSIKEYTKLAPNGFEIFRCKVKRIHKSEPTANGVPQRKRSVAQTNGVGDPSVQQLKEVIQEALECHFKGMEFVEDNAGKQLDEHMKEEGFKITYGVKRDTGFVFGGNEWNCGTWMDKMGSSEKAGNKGKPATPRDGSAVEIVGLCKAVVTWLDEMFKNRHYPFDGVECLYDNTIKMNWTWKKWASMIQANFEKYFYVPTEEETPAYDDPNANLINCRGIYKDSFGASSAWQDYQLRPNFLVTMVVAPELFDKDHAKNALNMVKEKLCGPLGMKTLDPSDWNYKGDYDNGNDSGDASVSHGFNYHQGPEWLWLTGYYIRASSKFCGSSERQHHLRLLANFYACLTDGPWLGLPELTNSGGKNCPDSCPIQSWSIGTALEALHESVRNV